MNTPIQIILPHKEAFGAGHAGAVGLVVRRIAAAPSRHAVRVIGPAFPGTPFPGIDFRPVPTSKFPSQVWSYALGVASLLAATRRGPIEVHNKPELAMFLRSLFPRRPITLFLHNDPRTMRGARTPAQRAKLLNRMHAVVCVSHHLCAALIEGMHALPRAPVVIHNALDPAELPPPMPQDQREKVILFAGRVVPDKAPDAFIAACALALPNLPGWRAEIIGADGFDANGRETPFIRRLRPLAEAAGVAMLGYRPHDQVLTALSRAAIAVVPSRWQEPFGLAALEAMGCGAALACSMRGGLAEIAGTVGMAFNPDNIPAAAAALTALATNPARRAAIAEAGLARARSEFSMSTAMVVLENLRDHAAAGTRRSSRRVLPPRAI